MLKRSLPRPRPGLPRYFGHVDAKRRVPVRAIVLVAVLILLLSLLNLGSGTYVAFGAITSLTSLASYLSYLIALSCSLHARLVARDRGGGGGGFAPGPWRWGRRAGTAINVVAVVYTLYAMVWLVFPNYLPATASNMNYCGPVMGIVLLFVISFWFLSARKHWDGPNPAIVALVLKES